jgi:hypothetical protein
VSYTSAAYQGSTRSAWSWKKGESYEGKYIKGSTDITHLPGPGGQGFLSWILLANGPTRRGAAGEKQCNSCQRFSKQRHTLAAALKTILLTWSFAIWGLDMVAPFKTVLGGFTYLLVAMDKFTKWIEAKPIKKLNGS